MTRERRETLSAPLAHARSRFPPTQHKKAQHSLRLFTARKPFLAQHCTWWAIKFTQLKAKTRAACLGNISFDGVTCAKVVNCNKRAETPNKRLGCFFSYCRGQGYAYLTGKRMKSSRKPGRKDGSVGRNAGQRSSLKTDGRRDDPTGAVVHRLENFLRLTRLPRRRVPFA